jgi:exodeoxyribonuclease VII large subunit
VKEVIAQSFQDTYWIIAEVSGHKFYANNDRHYFDLVENMEGQTEPIAKIKSVSWKEGSASIAQFEQITGQSFTNGLQVLIRVKVEFHGAYGFQLILKEIDASFTLGNLEKKRRETLERLVAENPDSIRKVGEEYITKNKLLVLNTVIQSIAIIGSPNSEGYVDFKHTLEHNQFGYTFRVDIYQSAVQGLDAEKELANKFMDIYNSGIAYDCVVIIRGGGAKTDFVVFDTYHLARVAARFPFPIITGVGHHKDVSVVDLMVHTNTKTPTKAAEFIIAHNKAFEEQLLRIQKNIVIKTQQILAYSGNLVAQNNLSIVRQTNQMLSGFKDRLTGFKQVLVNASRTVLYLQQSDLTGLFNKVIMKPQMRVAHQQQELENCKANLMGFSRRYLINKNAYLAHDVSIVRLMSPQNILKRGFAMLSMNGKILSNTAGIQEHDELTIHTAGRQISTVVTHITTSDGNETNISAGV